MFRRSEFYLIILFLISVILLIIIPKLPLPNNQVYSLTPSIESKKFLPISMWYGQKRRLQVSIDPERGKTPYPLMDGSATCIVFYSFYYQRETIDIILNFDSDYCYESGEATFYANSILYALIAQLKRHPNIEGSVFDPVIRDEFITLLPDADNQIKEYVWINKP